MKLYTSLILVIVLLGSGCRSIGPKKVTRDRFDYSHSLADSWKSQMLLNIVKVRYLDLPIFLDVAQLVTGYTLETSVDVGGRFLQGFLTPIQPRNFFSLVQSGYAADFILELCLDSFNGLNNRSAMLASKRQPDPEFFQVLTLIRDVQDAGALGMKVAEPEEGQSAIVLFFRSENATEETRAKAAEVRRLLKVKPDNMEFELVYSPMHGGPGKLGVSTNSLWQILSAMSMGITVPESHLQRQLVPPLREIGKDEIPLFVCTAVRTNRRIATSLYPSRTSGSGSRMMTGNQNELSPPSYFSSHSRIQEVKRICRPSPFQPINLQMLSQHTI